MKIIKRNISSTVPQTTSLNIIKQYSKKVYNTNKEIIAEQKKRDEEREKEKEKQILELIGIKESNEDLININKKIRIIPSLSKKDLIYNPIGLINKAQIFLKNNDFTSISDNKRYNNQSIELRRCHSSDIDDEDKKSSNYNKSIKNNNNKNFIKVQINNDNNQRNIFTNENNRTKSPLETRKEYCEKVAKNINL